MGTAAEQDVRERAYEIWVAAGRPHGRAEDHWLRAEAEMQAGPPDAAAPAKAALKRAVPRTSPAPAPAKSAAGAKPGPKPDRKAGKPSAGASAT